MRPSCSLRHPLTQEKPISPPDTPPPDPAPDDENLAEQAHPGHGIPSQDTDPAAQFPLDSQEVEHEVHSVLMAGGMAAGMATGAAIGVAVAAADRWC